MNCPLGDVFHDKLGTCGTNLVGSCLGCPKSPGPYLRHPLEADRRAENGAWHLLEPIQSYCLLHNLPPITILVVSETTGMPGTGFVAAQDIPRTQMEVFAFDWLEHGSPSAEDLREAVIKVPSCGIASAAKAQDSPVAVPTYPPAECSEFIQRIAARPCDCDRKWVGNDLNGQVRHDRVPLGTFTLYLWWKAGPDSTPDEIKEIGAFRLDLEKLLEGEYVRWEDEEKSSVRLRFYRASDNIIYIQTKSNPDNPRIAVGTFP